MKDVGGPTKEERGSEKWDQGRKEVLIKDIDKVKDHAKRDSISGSIDENYGLQQHEKEDVDVSSSSIAMDLGKQKSMGDSKEFLHAGNKDVQADLKYRDLAGHFLISDLRTSRFSMRAVVIRTLALVMGALGAAIQVKPLGQSQKNN